MVKRARIDSRDCDVNHAMLITGYHVTNGDVERWQVENSHGTRVAKGYISMTHGWFESHAFAVSVPRDCAPKAAVRAHGSQDVIVLDPWDVLGIVAVVRPLHER